MILHSEAITILKDNGIGIYTNDFIEKVLDDSYSKDENQQFLYNDEEICDIYDISQSELDRMRHTLSYEYCHNKDGSYKFT